MGLAGILIEQGRYADAEKLIRSALDIQRTLGIRDETQSSAQILSQLGSVLTFQRKIPEAAQIYAELDKAIADWEPGAQAGARAQRLAHLGALFFRARSRPALPLRRRR